jgi:hypothetical protein
MQLVIEPGGCVRCLYAETIDVRALGAVRICRASHVEPERDGGWCADLAPMVGPRLGPFGLRSLALAAEQAWLERYWLHPAPGSHSLECARR